jgi:diaminobutyrate-2-oxoglutarate transaminase
VAGGLQITKIYNDAITEIAQTVGRWKTTSIVLTPTGSEAIDLALRLAWLVTGRRRIISFSNSYHGLTHGALRATGMECFRGRVAAFVDPENDTHILLFPDPLRFGQGRSQNTVEECLRIVSQTLGADSEIGAIIVEPMQNPAGYIFAGTDFLQGLRRLSIAHDVLLIVDEIFTGFGRCGSWLLCDACGIIPDIICVGKCMGAGFPVGACVCSRDFMNAFHPKDAFSVCGGTFNYHPVNCAAITTAIRTIREEGLATSCAESMSRLRTSCEDGAKTTDFVSDVRGYGNAVAIEFGDPGDPKDRLPRMAARFLELLQHNGVIGLITGLPYMNVVAFCPPLNLSPSEGESCCEAIRRSFAAMRRN